MMGLWHHVRQMRSMRGLAMSKTKGGSSSFWRNSQEVRKVFLLGFALAAVLTWEKLCFQDVVIYSLFASLERGDRLLDYVNLGANVASCLCFIALCIWSNAAEKMLERRFLIVLASVAASTSVLAMVCSGIEGAPIELMVACASVLAGSGQCLLLVIYGKKACFSGVPVAIASTAWAFVLSAMMYFVMCLLPPVWVAAMTLILPIAAGAVLCAWPFSNGERYKAEPAESPRARGEAIASIASGGRSGDMIEHQRVGNLIVRLAVVGALGAASLELARNIYLRSGVVGGEPTGSYVAAQGLAGSVVSIAAVLIAVALLRSRREEAMLKRCYRFAALMLVLSAVAIPVSQVFDAVSPLIPLMVDIASGQCFSFFIWIMAIGMCCRYENKVIRYYSLTRLFWIMGTLVGLLLSWAFIGGVGISLQSVFAASVLCVLLVNVAVLTVFTERDALGAMNVIPLERRKRFMEKCGRAIEHFGLTKREAEVMVLMAKGNSAARIQEVLCISAPTVSSHRQHIYQKMGIHSAQEIVDKIDLLGSKER